MQAPAAQNRFSRRAGSHALLIFTRVLNAQVIREHGEGVLAPGELESRLGWAAKASLRVATEHLRELGVIVRLEPGEEHVGTQTELTQAGKGLLGLADVIEDWLADGPLGGPPLPDVAARGAVKSLIGGWDATIVMALARDPQTLAELKEQIPAVSYPALKRRLTSLRSVGLVTGAPDAKDRRRQSHSAAPWLRSAIGPLSVASHWEGLNIPAISERMTCEDIEAAFLLVLPLVELRRDAYGECVLAAPSPPKSDGPRSPVAAVSIVVEKGRVVSCIPGMPERATNWALGTPTAWLETTIDGSVARLRIRGTTVAFTEEVTTGINRALFGR